MLTLQKINLIARFLLTITDPKKVRCGDPTEFCINNSEENIIKMAARHLDMSFHETNRLLRSEKFSDSSQIDQYRIALKFIASDLLDIPHFFDIVISNTDLINRITLPNSIIEDIGNLIQYDVRKFKLMFKFYIVFECLGLDTSSFKYWDSNLGLVTNLGRLGHSERTLAKAALRQHLKEHKARGFEKDILNNNYLMNNCQTLSIISDICSKDNLTASLLLMRLILPGLGSHSYRTVGNMLFLQAYTAKWKNWFDGEEILLMDDGNEFYFHRHNLQRELNECYRSGLFPDSMKDHPKDVYRDVIRKLANKEYNSFRKSLGGIPFPPLPKPLLRLNREQWRLLDSPYALAMEGKRMNHCVGGSNYVNRAREGNVYFRYEDGKNAAITIELRKSSVFVEDFDKLKFSPHWEGDVLYHYDIHQMKHRYNVDPTNELKRKILTELLDCGIGESVTIDRHARLLNCASSNSALHDMTTRRWVPYPQHNLSLVKRRQSSEKGQDSFGSFMWAPDMDLTHLYPQQAEVIVRPRTVHVDFAERLGRGMAGDFDGDYLNGYNRHEASMLQWLGRADRSDKIKGDLLIPKPSSMSDECIEYMFDEYEKTQIHLGSQISRVVVNLESDNIPGILACRLLARRVRYGFISLDEMLKMHLRLRIRGKYAFNMEISSRSGLPLKYALDSYLGWNAKIHTKRDDTIWNALDKIAAFQIHYSDSLAASFFWEPVKPTITPLFVTNLLGGYNLNLNLIPR